MQDTGTAGGPRDAKRYQATNNYLKSTLTCALICHVPPPNPHTCTMQALQEVHLVLGNVSLSQEYRDLCADMSRSGTKGVDGGGDGGGRVEERVSATAGLLMQEAVSLIARHVS